MTLYLTFFVMIGWANCLQESECCMHKATNMWGKEKAPRAEFEMACSIADSPSLLQGRIAHMQSAKECH